MTPGRHMPREHREAARDDLAGLGHRLDLLRRLADDHQTLASSTASAKLLGASVARIWSWTWSGVREPSIRRRIRWFVVVLDQRLGLLAGTARAGAGPPPACRRRARPGGCRRRRSGPACLGGSKSTWKLCCPLTHTRRPDRRRTTSSSGTSISSAAVSVRPSCSSSSSSASACCSVRGKPSRMKPFGGVRLLEALDDHLDDQVVGHEVAAVHVLLGLQRRARSLRARRRAACCRSRCRAGRSPRRAAPPGCPCRRPGGPSRTRFSSGTAGTTSGSPRSCAS